MKSTGLEKYEYATVENFTSDVGLKVRKIINGPWRSILKIATKREIIVERYPQLPKNKNYIFVCNHSFDEDVISILQTIDRNVYLLNGTTDQTEHNPVFIAMWANGMVYVNRKSEESRTSSVEKMRRVLRAGNSVMLFSEGGYNNTENQLIMPLFNGAYYLSKEENVEIVPIISFNEPGSNKIYIRADNPVDIRAYDKYEGMSIIRDKMATIVYDIILDHTKPLKREELGPDPRAYYMEIRKQVYECQKWYNDVWDEELTMYNGHGVTTPEQAFAYVDNIKITPENAHIIGPLIAPILARREEEKKYDLKQYLRENIVLQKK